MLFAGGVVWFASRGSRAAGGAGGGGSDPLSVLTTPWPERARTVANSMYGAEGKKLATNILAITHPTGANPQLANYSVTIEGDQLVSRFDVSWNGGGLGMAYVTSVEWRCSQSSSGSAHVTRDTAMIHVAGTNAAELDIYFQTSMYKTIMAAAN